MISADTNILVYAVDDRDREGRQSVARAVVLRLTAMQQPIALQVVGELQNVLRRRLKLPPHVAMQQARNIFVTFPNFAYDAGCVEIALGQAAAGRFSYWDALLLAACSRAGITTLLSEDMQDGSVFQGVQIVNPFSPQGLSPRARERLQL
ncbi:PIN domain-containing protein [Phenylobacterium sp.]|uniref:PIN domain-containing protein n=1 Tax=Phenylobacterium sp. TaxID=1871053 RepID=UPI00286B8ECC|nr:PIN domain-containing protein [Phenylobacterium sp.]